MRKFLERWLNSLEASDAKLKDQGYTVIHGAGVSYLVPVHRPQITGYQEPNPTTAASIWAKICRHRHRQSSTKTASP
jgi:hypothetical protein